MHLFVRSFRLLEALNEYRKNGLNYFQYVKCKNYALRKFIPDFFWIVINSKKSGFKYINFKIHIFHSLVYPNFYLSFFLLF